MTHLAYNVNTGEVIITSHANTLKRRVAHHTAHDRRWLPAHGYTYVPAKWVFVHGGSHNECIAKLQARKVCG